MLERLGMMVVELWRGLSVILTHRIFWACFTAWFTASGIKVLIFFLKNRRFDFKLLIDTGRMPSSHSAFAAALATVIGLEAGWQSPVFMLSLGFAIVVMNDAAGVRRAAGQQARILNRMMDDLDKRKVIQDERLKEFLGHTRPEVAAGAFIGVLIASLFYL